MDEPWREMDREPPEREYLGRQIIVTVQPKYGEPYTEAMRWPGKGGFEPAGWPDITHWRPMPKPAKKKEG